MSPYVVPKGGPRYRPSKVWYELSASRARNASEFCQDPNQPWFEVKHSFSTKSNDLCHVGSWVFASTETIGGGSVATLSEMGPTICGRIVELLAAAEHSVKGIAVINVYQMLATRHPIFGMPSLVNTTPHGECLVIVPTEVCRCNIYPRVSNGLSLGFRI